MKFTKVHGLGNDFVLIDCVKRNVEIEEDTYKALAKQICDRHFGVGADGILLVLPSDRADIRMRIINSDGSEAEMCGNGIRCFARYVYERGIVAKSSMTVETLAGIIVPKMIFRSNGTVQGVEVDMGEPILEKEQIPMIGTGTAIGETIFIEEAPFIVTAVSMGNPHCVSFVEDAKTFPIEVWGPKIERSSYFPRKTNVEFVQVLNKKEVIMRVWERGAAVTLACGTGACASTVACILNGKTERDVLLHLDGGDLHVRWDEVSNHIFMTGPAEEVFDGEWKQEAVQNG